MRLMGCAQRALELMCQCSLSRMAFGRSLAERGSVREDIANAFCEIARARLLTLQAADEMDSEGNKAARDRERKIPGAEARGPRGHVADAISVLDGGQLNTMREPLRFSQRFRCKGAARIHERLAQVPKRVSVSLGHVLRHREPHEKSKEI